MDTSLLDRIAGTGSDPDGVYDAALAWAGRFREHPPEVLAAAKAAFSAPRSVAGP